MNKKPIRRKARERGKEIEKEQENESVKKKRVSRIYIYISVCSKNECT